MCLAKHSSLSGPSAHVQSPRFRFRERFRGLPLTLKSGTVHKSTNSRSRQLTDRQRRESTHVQDGGAPTAVAGPVEPDGPTGRALSL